MKKRKFISVCLCVWICTLVFYGCGGEDTVEPVYSLSVSPSSLTLEQAKGAQGTFTIKALRDGNDAAWSIENNTDLVTVSPMSGTGIATITVVTKENNDGNAHAGTLKVTCGDQTAIVTITQKGIDQEMMVSVENILQMSKGIACSTRPGGSVKYYYLALYETTEFNKLGSDQNIANDILTKSNRMFYSDYPENITNGKFGLDYQDVIAWYSNIQSDHHYTIVAVPYDAQSKLGVISHYDVSTKSQNNQPDAKPTEYSSIEKDGKTYHQWTATMSAFCNYYYTYACVGPDEFSSYKRKDEGIVLAWNIMMQIPSITSDGLNVSFNAEGKSTNKYREFLWPKMASTAQLAELQMDKNTDKYIQVVTWGFKNTGQSYTNPVDCVNAECSGIIYMMNNKIESSASDVSVNTLLGTSVLSYQATLNASVSGLTSASKCGFEYGTSSSSLTSIEVGTIESGSFSYSVKTLKPNTQYVYRAWVMNSGKKLYGSYEYFTTAGELFDKTGFDDNDIKL